MACVKAQQLVSRLGLMASNSWLWAAVNAQGVQPLVQPPGSKSIDERTEQKGAAATIEGSDIGGQDAGEVYTAPPLPCVCSGPERSMPFRYHASANASSQVMRGILAHVDMTGSFTPDLSSLSFPIVGRLFFLQQGGGGGCTCAHVHAHTSGCYAATTVWTLEALFGTEQRGLFSGATCHVIGYWLDLLTKFHHPQE